MMNLNTIFQKINSNKLKWLRNIFIIINTPVNFLDIFSVKIFLSMIQSNDSIQQYKNFIKQRFQDENIDHKRPLMEPKQCFVNIDDLDKFSDIKTIDFNFKKNDS